MIKLPTDGTLHILLVNSSISLGGGPTSTPQILYLCLKNLHVNALQNIFACSTWEYHECDFSKVMNISYRALFKFQFYEETK